MALKNYTITSGQFRLADGSLRGVGETIELEDDVAEQHAGRVQPVDAAAPVQTSAAQPAADE